MERWDVYQVKVQDGKGSKIQKTLGNSCAGAARGPDIAIEYAELSGLTRSDHILEDHLRKEDKCGSRRCGLF